MRHLAVLSLHTSPLVQPGAGDGGGMTVYVREVVSALARAGGQATVFTRRTDDRTPGVVEVEPGFRVVQVDAGRRDLRRSDSRRSSTSLPTGSPNTSSTVASTVCSPTTG